MSFQVNDNSYYRIKDNNTEVTKYVREITFLASVKLATSLSLQSCEVMNHIFAKHW